MPWRCGLMEDFSDLAATADPEAFPGPLDVPDVATFKLCDVLAPATSDGPGPPATESACPTAAMAVSLSLGRVLVEPIE